MRSFDLNAVLLQHGHRVDAYIGLVVRHEARAKQVRLALPERRTLSDRLKICWSKKGIGILSVFALLDFVLLFCLLCEGGIFASVCVRAR